MKTREEILDNKFKERGILKGWIDESRNAVLDAIGWRNKNQKFEGQYVIVPCY
jgi:hypothetical protein